MCLAISQSHLGRYCVLSLVLAVVLLAMLFKLHRWVALGVWAIPTVAVVVPCKS